MTESSFSVRRLIGVLGVWGLWFWSRRGANLDSIDGQADEHVPTHEKAVAEEMLLRDSSLGRGGASHEAEAVVGAQEERVQLVRYW